MVAPTLRQEWRRVDGSFTVGAACFSMLRPLPLRSGRGRRIEVSISQVASRELFHEMPTARPAQAFLGFRAALAPKLTHVSAFLMPVHRL